MVVLKNVAAEEKEDKETEKTVQNEEKAKTFKELAFTEKVEYVKELISIEPMICLLVVAKVMCGPATHNLHFEKACRVNAGFNDTVCDAVISGTYLELNFKDQNDEVQSYITDVRAWEIPVASVIPVILVLFLGSYSDRHKIRKPFLLIPLIGDVVSLLGTVLNVIYIREWPLEVQVVADKIIPSLFGAEKLIIMISYAYIADISTPEIRVLRMAVIPLLINVFIPITQAVSGVLFSAGGYFPVLGLSLTFTIIAFFYGVFKVKEPQPCKEDTKELIKDVFNVQNVVETFQLLTKKNAINRIDLIFLLVLCFIHTVVSSGEHSTMFLFTQAAYQWTAVNYTYLIAAVTLSHFIGLSLGVPLFVKVFHLNDLIIIIIAYLDAILTSVVIVVFNSPIALYASVAIGVLTPPGNAATRSQLTKVVSTNDMAKALSLNTIVSAGAASVAAQIYHKGIYEHTRRTFPQAFFLFGVGMHLLGIVLLVIMYRREKKMAKNENESDSDRNERLQGIDNKVMVLDDEMTHI